MNAIKKFEIYLANLDPIIGSEQSGTRPVLIIQNNIGNQYSPVTIIAAFTSKTSKQQPHTVHIEKKYSKLEKDSLLLCNQIKTLDMSRLIKKIGEIQNPILQETINETLKMSLDLDNKLL